MCVGSSVCALGPVKSTLRDTDKKYSNERTNKI